MQRALAAFLMSVQLVGCTYWKIEALPPAALIEHQQPSVVRVNDVDGRRQLLYQPGIRGDSLVGSRNYDSNRRDRAVPVAGVTQLETHHVSANRTVGLLMGIGAVVGAALLIAVAGMQGPFDNWGQ